MDQDKGRSKRADVIDENLKRVYDDMLEEEVPDKFLNLLAKLREQDNKKDGSGENA